MAVEEEGYKWWLRYVAVPLIGTGGLVALVAAYISRPQPVERIQQPTVPATSSIASQQKQDEVEAVKLVSWQWLTAFHQGDIQAMKLVSNFPFDYPAGKLLEYQALSAFASDAKSARERYGEPKVLNLTVVPVSTDGFMHCFRLAPGDFAVTVNYFGQSAGKFVVKRFATKHLVTGAC
ncbi:hypothetical protein [Sphaerotilus sp.]|uniref:hypothetical protein n=1 Tax=Sphaerotilus sp. TaxID=2093942 RepID=UPI0025D49321|nr:hypothetical protein [Sphaerotilus sp.]